MCRAFGARGDPPAPPGTVARRRPRVDHVTARRIGAFISGVPILAVAIVVLLVWLLVGRTRPVHPFVRAAGLACLSLCAAAVALRAGAVGTAVVATAAMMLGLWLGQRGRGGDDRGDDGPDQPPPVDPDPGAGRRAEPSAGVIDAEAFDRARADWDRDLGNRS